MVDGVEVGHNAEFHTGSHGIGVRRARFHAWLCQSSSVPVTSLSLKFLFSEWIKSMCFFYLVEYGQNEVYGCHQDTRIVTPNVGIHFSGEVIVWEWREGRVIIVPPFVESISVSSVVLLRCLVPWELKVLAFFQVIYNPLHSRTLEIRALTRPSACTFQPSPNNTVLCVVVLLISFTPQDTPSFAHYVNYLR